MSLAVVAWIVFIVAILAHRRGRAKGQAEVRKHLTAQLGKFNALVECIADEAEGIGRVHPKRVAALREMATWN